MSDIWSKRLGFKRYILFLFLSLSSTYIFHPFSVRAYIQTDRPTCDESVAEKGPRVRGRGRQRVDRAHHRGLTATGQVMRAGDPRCVTIGGITFSDDA